MTSSVLPPSLDGRPDAEQGVERAVRAWFRRHRGRVLLAVSGGVDSLALLLAAASAEPARVEVASVDHGVRPESAEEVRFVLGEAARLGLQAHALRLELRAGPGWEAAAREARYAALEQLAEARGIPWIATAHTADDQAETLLMRLARGASLRGASGVRSRRGRIVRPLLEVTRGEVEAYVTLRGRTPVRDPSNADPAQSRARMRHGALPALVAAAGPAATRHLASFAERSAEDEAVLEEAAAHALKRLRRAAGLDAVGMRALPPAIRRRAWVAWLEGEGVAVDAGRVLRVDAALADGGRTGLPGRRQLRTEGGWVRLQRAVPAPEPVALPPNRWVEFGEVQLAFAPDGGSARWCLALPSAVPRAIRARRPGDVVRGPSGRRRVQDVFTDARVPAERRDRWPLVVGGEDQVLWVVGHWPRPARSAAGPCVLAEPTASAPFDAWL